MFGAAHMTGDRLAFATITVAYLIAAIPLEERSLTEVLRPRLRELQAPRQVADVSIRVLKGRTEIVFGDVGCRTSCRMVLQVTESSIWIM